VQLDDALGAHALENRLQEPFARLVHHAAPVGGVGAAGAGTNVASRAAAKRAELKSGGARPVTP